MVSPDIGAVQPEQVPPVEVPKEASQIREIAKVIFFTTNTSQAAIGDIALYENGPGSYSAYRLEPVGYADWALTELTVTKQGITIAEESGDAFSRYAAPHQGDINAIVYGHKQFNWQMQPRQYNSEPSEEQGERDKEKVASMIRSLQKLLVLEIGQVQKLDPQLRGRETKAGAFVRACRAYPEAMEGAVLEDVGSFSDIDALLETLTQAELLVGFTGTKDDITDDVVLGHAFHLKRDLIVQNDVVDSKSGQEQVIWVRKNSVNLAYNPVSSVSEA